MSHLFGCTMKRTYRRILKVLQFLHKKKKKEKKRRIKDARSRERIDAMASFTKRAQNAHGDGERSTWLSMAIVRALGTWLLADRNNNCNHRWKIMTRWRDETGRELWSEDAGSDARGDTRDDIRTWHTAVHTSARRNEMPRNKLAKGDEIIA